MEINLRKDGGLSLSFTQEEKEIFLCRLYQSHHNVSASYFRNLLAKIEDAENASKALPIFILSGNLRDAKYYAEKNKIKKYGYVGDANILRGYKAIELHIVRSGLLRKDLLDIDRILLWTDVKKIYE